MHYMNYSKSSTKVCLISIILKHSIWFPYRLTTQWNIFFNFFSNSMQTLLSKTFLVFIFSHTRYWYIKHSNNIPRVSLAWIYSKQQFIEFKLKHVVYNWIHGKISILILNNIMAGVTYLNNICSFFPIPLSKKSIS